MPSEGTCIRNQDLSVKRYATVGRQLNRHGALFRWEAADVVVAERIARVLVRLPEAARDHVQRAVPVSGRG